MPSPSPRPSRRPAPSAPTHGLSYGRPIAFTLLAPISSASAQLGQRFAVSLKVPLVVDGTTIAPIGARTYLRVLAVRAADAGDVYGYVDVEFEPLHLADGRTVPLVTPRSHLAVHVTAGHASTVGIENTVEDIFIPPFSILQALRRGRNVVLPAGTTLTARLGASLALADSGIVEIATPAPLPMVTGTPASDFPALPLYTPTPRPTPRPTPTPQPTSTPAPQPSPSPTP